MPTRSDAASQIWPHLAKQPAPAAQTQRDSALAAAMYPAHVPKAPRPEWELRYRDSLLRNLKETSAALRQR
jgi:hypothetical protein